MSDLKFEAGKHYKTRAGFKATVYLIRPTYMVGEIEGFENENPWHWNSGGVWFRAAVPMNWDLVAEWREPARVTVRLYRSLRDGSIMAINSADPLNETHWQLIAQREIVEGEGLQ